MTRKRVSEKSPVSVPMAIVGLVLLAGASFWLGRASVLHEQERVEAPVPHTPSAEAELSPAPAPPSTPPEEPPPAPAAAEAPAPGPAPILAKAERPAKAPTQDALYDLSVSIKGSVTRTLIEALGREVGDPLSMVTGRLLVWWLDVARDLRKGDDLHLVYELPEGSEPIVHALSFTSQKLRQTFHAYRYLPPEASFPRYFDREGREIELRLERSPIESYEQVTSLLRDGRGHAGVDFKAPAGLPIVSPFSGVVTRTNFNTRINGNCVEIKDDKGRKALYLHLSSVDPKMKPGARVRRGQKVGLSGNTGRSTAPHLHYQLMKGGRVLDPFKVHPTYRISLDPAHMEDFQRKMRALDGRLRQVASSDGRAR